MNVCGRYQSRGLHTGTIYATATATGTDARRVIAAYMNITEVWQGRRRDWQYLDVPICKQVLDEGPVGPGHASVVDGEAEGQQVAQVRVLAGLCFRLQDLPAGLALLSHAQSSSQQDALGA